jgi:hypothetical protein
MKDMAAQLKEREQFLIESAERPLAKSQEKLLTQLLQEEGKLDLVLSSQAYLTYIEEQIGGVYEDYSAYLDAVPTAEQKSTILFVFKEICPSGTTDEQVQICTDFYFKFRKRIANEPDITSDSKKMQEFATKHLIDPLMDTYSSKMPLSEMFTMMQVTTVPSAMAPMDTDAFRNIWLKYLKIYGPREGLLRCAITTPDEFALVRSFFKDAATLEEWIIAPSQGEVVPEEGLMIDR